MTEEYTVYARRWYYLLVASLVNFSNGQTWITYASITFFTNDFYGSNAAVYFNVIFMVLSIPGGIVCIWFMERFGLRASFLLGAWTNFLGNVVRLVGSGTFIPHDLRFPIAFTGQVIASIAQPYAMFLPTKLSAHWFPDDQRAIANTLSSMANPIGIAVMYAIAPVFVNKDHPDNFFLMNGIVTALAAVTALSSLPITRSDPPTPPSASKDDALDAPPFWEGIKRCFKSKTFWILGVCLGGGVGLFNTLYNNLQPALCVKGYSPAFNGGMGALLIISGLFGAAAAGIIVDKYHNFEEVMKIAYTLSGLCAASLTVAINYEGQIAWIVCSLFFLGFFGFAIYPIGLEMGVEATYPVSEATSTGLILMLGQIQGVLYVIATNLAASPADPHEAAVQTCVDHNSEIKTLLEWKVPFIIWAACLVTLIILFSACFWPKYKRRDYELARSLGAGKAICDPDDQTTIGKSSRVNTLDDFTRF